MSGSQSTDVLPSPVFADDAPHLLIVVAPYYRDIADNLVLGAKAAIAASGATFECVEVPGALEIPSAIRLAGQCSEFEGFVALGCVIRGQTTHYETVCNDTSRALSLLGIEGFCIGNGVLTVENRGQAEVRADAKGQNKGGAAAHAALHLIALSRRFLNRNKPIGFKPAIEQTVFAGNSDKSFLT